MSLYATRLPAYSHFFFSEGWACDWSHLHCNYKTHKVFSVFTNHFLVQDFNTVTITVYLITHSTYHCNYNTYKDFSVFTRCFLVTDFNSWDSSASVLSLLFTDWLATNNWAPKDQVENTVSNSSSIVIVQLLLFKNLLPSTSCCLVVGFHGRCPETGLYATILKLFYFCE
jgi:hypothetical protein